MNSILKIEGNQVKIAWDSECGSIQTIIHSKPLEGIANNIGSEVFFLSV